MSVIVAKLDVVGIAVDESKTNPPLVVHGNRVLANSVAFQRMQTIARWNFQIVQTSCQIDVFKLPSRSLGNVDRITFRLTVDVQLLGASVTERLDHPAKCNSSRDTCQATTSVGQGKQGTDSNPVVIFGY